MMTNVETIAMNVFLVAFVTVWLLYAVGGKIIELAGAGYFSALYRVWKVRLLSDSHFGAIKTRAVHYDNVSWDLVDIENDALAFAEHFLPPAILHAFDIPSGKDVLRILATGRSLDTNPAYLRAERMLGMTVWKVVQLLDAQPRAILLQDEYRRISAYLPINDQPDDFADEIELDGSFRTFDRFEIEEIRKEFGALAF